MLFILFIYFLEDLMHCEIAIQKHLEVQMITQILMFV